jgi:hypothetical protein
MRIITFTNNLLKTPYISGLNGNLNLFIIKFYNLSYFNNIHYIIRLKVKLWKLMRIEYQKENRRRLLDQ